MRLLSRLLAVSTFSLAVPVFANPPPQNVMPGKSFTTEDARNKPMTPDSWVGLRPPVDGDWVQTFNEDFKAGKLNDKAWNTQLSWPGTLPGWMVRFSKDNLIFEDGVLKIKAEKRTGFTYDDPKQPARDYTSAIITTYDRWRQCYGYFEARMKLPTARGLWPAFFMMPDRGPSVTGPGPVKWSLPARETTYNGGNEFDILEHLTEWGPGIYNTAEHWEGYEQNEHKFESRKNYYGQTPDGWHNWGMLWEPGKVTWYCDGVKEAQYEGKDVATAAGEMIIQCQAGGWATHDIDDAHLPDYLQVDYVRVWQTKDRMDPEFPAVPAAADPMPPLPASMSDSAADTPPSASATATNAAASTSDQAPFPTYTPATSPSVPDPK